MSTKQERMETALAAIHAREAAKRPKPVEPAKTKRKDVTVNVTAAPVEVEHVVEEVTFTDDPVEVRNEIDEIGEGDQ